MKEVRDLKEEMRMERENVRSLYEDAENVREELLLEIVEFERAKRKMGKA